MPQPALLFSCFSVDATHLVGICKVHTCNKKTFFSIHQWVQARQFLYTYLLYILIFCIRVNYQVDHLFHSNVSGGSPTNFRSQLNHRFALTLPAVKSTLYWLLKLTVSVSSYDMVSMWPINNGWRVQLHGSVEKQKKNKRKTRQKKTKPNTNKDQL